MGGPYEHFMQSQTVGVLRGRIELDAGGHRIVATVLGGEASLEIAEEYDEITAFGTDTPIRYINPRHRLQVRIDCGLDEMTITVDPEPGPEAAKR